MQDCCAGLAFKTHHALFLEAGQRRGEAAEGAAAVRLRVLALHAELLQELGLRLFRHLMRSSSSKQPEATASSRKQPQAAHGTRVPYLHTRGARQRRAQRPKHAHRQHAFHSSVPGHTTDHVVKTGLLEPGHELDEVAAAVLEPRLARRLPRRREARHPAARLPRLARNAAAWRGAVREDGHLPLQRSVVQPGQQQLLDCDPTASDKKIVEAFAGRG